MFWIILIAVAVIVIIYRSSKAQENSNNKKDWDAWRNAGERERFTDKNIPVDSERLVYMSLETFHIVETSSKIDTVLSRISLLHDVLGRMELTANLKEYWRETVRVTIEKYEQAYYDKPVNDMVKGYVLNPQMVLNNWDIYYDQKLFDCVYRYARSQDAHLTVLKTARAKENRVLKIVSMVDNVKTLAKSETAKARLEELKQKLLGSIKRL